MANNQDNIDKVSHKEPVVLTVVVPCYNSEAYLNRCIDSLLVDQESVQIIIVNDGSTDSTIKIARSYEQNFPGLIEIVDKPNGGHGSAINVGIELARGKYIKIVDSDDWLNATAYRSVLDVLGGFVEADEEVDLLLSNFVYEKEGRHRKRCQSYTSVLPEKQIFGWNQVKSLRPWQYLMMHTMIYRTEVLRECQLKLPEHSFYVDNLYAFVPLPHVKTLYYLNVDFYRYFIGRDDQSVNEKVMIGRLDQQENINWMMFDHLSKVHQNVRTMPNQLRYMLHYLEVITLVTSVLMIRTGKLEKIAAKDAFWEKMMIRDPALASYMKRRIFGRFVMIPGRLGKRIVNWGYVVAKALIGFN